MIPITRSPSTAETCSVSGGTVVYSADGGDSIKAFDLVTMKKRELADPFLCKAPAMHGDRVVWMQKASAEDTTWELVVYDNRTATT